MNHQHRTPNLLLDITAVLIGLFGIATVFSGARVIFGTGGETAGAVVPFVVWFNFLAGFGYIATAIGLWRRLRWATGLAIALAATTLFVFAAFGVHAASGGAFEMRTVWAMVLRSTVLVAVTAAAWRVLGLPGRST